MLEFLGNFEYSRTRPLLVRHSVNFVIAGEDLVQRPRKSEENSFVTAGGFNTTGFGIAGRDDTRVCSSIQAWVCALLEHANVQNYAQ